MLSEQLVTARHTDTETRDNSRVLTLHSQHSLCLSPLTHTDSHTAHSSVSPEAAEEGSQPVVSTQGQLALCRTSLSLGAACPRVYIRCLYIHWSLLRRLPAASTVVDAVACMWRVGTGARRVAHEEATAELLHAVPSLTTPWGAALPS